jgi:hypothetical protein
LTILELPLYDALTYSPVMDVQTVKLYERCLIACANYPEYWIRYVQRMDTEGNLDLAMDALHRATTVFVKVRATSLSNCFCRVQPLLSEMCYVGNWEAATVREGHSSWRLYI